MHRTRSGEQESKKQYIHVVKIKRNYTMTKTTKRITNNSKKSEFFMR